MKATDDHTAPAATAEPADKILRFTRLEQICYENQDTSWEGLAKIANRGKVDGGTTAGTMQRAAERMLAKLAKANEPTRRTDVVLEDLSDHATAHEIRPLLFEIREKIRSRKTHGRDKVGRICKQLGCAPNPDTWRDLARRYLRRHLPKWTAIYVGGHHIAIHTIEPSTTPHPRLGLCLGRFVEAGR